MYILDEKYPRSYECNWKFVAKEGDVVKFEMDKDDMSLSKGDSPVSINGRWEWLENKPDLIELADVFHENDDGPENPKVINKESAYWAGLIHFSEGNTLQVKFAPGPNRGTDPRFRGFKATVSSLPQFKNKEIELKEGESVTITSPHYNGKTMNILSFFYQFITLLHCRSRKNKNISLF